jgi:quercetin dioxygenase-like cupin family protein
LVTVQVTFAPHAFSGWHHHPGVILVLVKSGHVTTHDANCQTKTYGPGQAFVESGSAPFMVSNESDTETAVDVATQVAPAGSAFRIEDDPPPCASS